MRSGLGELITEVSEVDQQQETVPLGMQRLLMQTSRSVAGRTLTQSAVGDGGREPTVHVSAKREVAPLPCSAPRRLANAGAAAQDDFTLLS
jgi:hypothetical protein